MSKQATKQATRKSMKPIAVYFVDSNYGRFEIAVREDGTIFTREYGFNGYGRGMSKWAKCFETTQEVLDDYAKYLAEETPNFRLPNYEQVPNLAEIEAQKAARELAHKEATEKAALDNETFDMLLDINHNGNYITFEKGITASHAHMIIEEYDISAPTKLRGNVSGKETIIIEE